MKTIYSLGQKWEVDIRHNCILRTIWNHRKKCLCISLPHGWYSPGVKTRYDVHVRMKGDWS